MWACVCICIDIYVLTYISRYGYMYAYLVFVLAFDTGQNHHKKHGIMFYEGWGEDIHKVNVCYLWASMWRDWTYQSCLVWAKRSCMLVGYTLPLQWQHTAGHSSQMHVLTCLHMTCKPTGLCLVFGVLIQPPKLWAKHHAHSPTSKHSKCECGKNVQSLNVMLKASMWLFYCCL